MDDFQIRTAAELISAIISPQVAEAAGAWSKVVGTWPRLAGERAAAHSRITDIENHFVLVEADHPGWIQLLQFRQSEILEDVQKKFPELDVRGIQFRLTQKGRSVDREAAVETRKEASSSAAEQSSPEPEAPIHLEHETIQDETLKKALTGLRDALEGR